MGRTAQREIDQVLDCQRSAAPVEATDGDLAAQNRRHFEVDELGRGQHLATQASASDVACLGVVPQCGGQNPEHR